MNQFASSDSHRGKSDEIGGSDDDELVQAFFSRSHDLDLLFEKDILTGSDIAGALLTGGKPRADLLPQKGSQVAPVATLLSREGDDLAVSATSGDEEKGVLTELLISPIRKFSRAFSGVSMLPVEQDPRANSWEEKPAVSERLQAQLCLRHERLLEQYPERSDLALRFCTDALILTLSCRLLDAARGKGRRASNAPGSGPICTTRAQQLLARLRARLRGSKFRH